MEDEPTYVTAAREYQRRYYLEHRAAKLEYARTYLAEHRDEINAKRRIPGARRKGIQRNITGPDKANYNRLYHVEVSAGANLRQRIRALQRISGVAQPICAKCGEADIRVLAINHRNGDGGIERRRIGRNGRWIARAVASGERDGSDLDVLCFNCNIRFEYDRGRRRLPRDWAAVVAEEVAAWPSTP